MRCCETLFAYAQKEKAAGKGDLFESLLRGAELFRELPRVALGKS